MGPDAIVAHCGMADVPGQSPRRPALARVLRTMIEAFHLVPSRQAMDRIVARGEILPGSMRLDPDLFLEKCELEFLELAEKASIDEDVKLNATVLGALKDLARESIEGLRRLQRSFGSEGTQRTTQYACPDLLAGDLQRVFLSVQDWPHWAAQISEEDRFHGFVFNAEDLVEKGARLRPKDLLKDYRWALEDLLRTRMRSKDRAYVAAIKALDRVQRDGEWKSGSAIAFLISPSMYESRERAREEGSTVELVWDGPLPLEWAVEVKPEMLT